MKCRTVVHPKTKGEIEVRPDDLGESQGKLRRWSVTDQNRRVILARTMGDSMNVEQPHTLTSSRTQQGPQRRCRRRLDDMHSVDTQKG